MSEEITETKTKAPARKTPQPLSRRALEALEFMVDHRVWLLSQNLTTANVSWDRRNAHYLSLPKDSNGYRLGAPHVDFSIMESLRMRGYIAQLDKAKLCEKYGLPTDENTTAPKSDGRGRRYGYFAWYDLPYGVTKEGFAYMAASRERLAALRAEDAARPEELIVVKGKDWSGHIEREADFAGALCRVVRRTPKRIYVEVLDRGVAQSSVQGSGGPATTYVDPADVFMEGVTRERFETMKTATTAFMESIRGARKKMDADIQAVLAPIRQRYEQRRVQLKAQYQDEVTGVPEEKRLEPKR